MITETKPAVAWISSMGMLIDRETTCVSGHFQRTFFTDYIVIPDEVAHVNILSFRIGNRAQFISAVGAGMFRANIPSLRLEANTPDLRLERYGRFRHADVPYEISHGEYQFITHGQRPREPWITNVVQTGMDVAFVVTPDGTPTPPAAFEVFLVGRVLQ